MGVIHGYHAPTRAARTTERAPLDRDAAELFVRAQSSWLRQGLARACDPAAVGIVLAAHDASHESWLSLISAVEQRAPGDAARALSTLYAFHGRVAGTLERGPDNRLSAAVAAGVRRLLEERLAELTDAAVTALLTLGSPERQRLR